MPNLTGDALIMYINMTILNGAKHYVHYMQAVSPIAATKEPKQYIYQMHACMHTHTMYLSTHTPHTLRNPFLIKELIIMYNNTCDCNNSK